MDDIKMSVMDDIRSGKGLDELFQTEYEVKKSDPYKKLRACGETIDPKKNYIGRKVIGLMNESYNNGYNKGLREAISVDESVRRMEYESGYKAGYEEATELLGQIKGLLLELLK